MSQVRRFGIYTDEYAGVVRFFWFPLLAWCFHRESGVFWIGTGRLRISLKAPWNDPLPSERFGGAKHIPLVGGWRVRFWRLEV